MKERPILFSAPMVRAILEGRKTQTRRLVRIDDTPISEAAVRAHRNQRGIPSNAVNVRMLGYLKCDAPPGSFTVSARVDCPFGVSGDRLWVKETFCRVDDGEGGGGRWIDYRATPRFGSAERPAGWDNAPDDAEALKWKPSIFMPRSASRITLEVTGVRVERLQAITNYDAVAEGAQRFDDIPDPHPYGQGDRWQMLDDAPASTEQCLGSPRWAFANAWEAINGKRAGAAWGDNPWVWVVEFRRAEAAARSAA